VIQATGPQWCLDIQAEITVARKHLRCKSAAQDKHQATDVPASFLRSATSAFHQSLTLLLSPGVDRRN
jgi:hypothetical protein